MNLLDNVKIFVPDRDAYLRIYYILEKEFNLSISKNNFYRYLYITGNEVFGLSCKEQFENIPMDQISYNAIIDELFYVRLSWFNKKTIQCFDGKNWIDWNNFDSIDFRISDKWRVKPRIYTQWERKYWDGERVKVAYSLKNKPEWDPKLKWVTEQEIFHYEI